jgi:putative glutamine amidotransferase
MGTSRPTIGITMRIDYESERFYLARQYSEAVASAGGDPVHLSLIPDEDYLASIIIGLDGILLPGSASDVDPSRYGENPIPSLGSVHPLKDETDLIVLRLAEASNLPVLAICFGMQSLNVSRGGTLIQDINTQVPRALKHEQGTPRDRKSHAVSFAPGSFLSQCAGQDQALVNSHHHQAVRQLGRDLVATAWAADGVVEGVEDARVERWVVGVQWHPEIGWHYDSLSRALFRTFVAAAREHAIAGSVRVGALAVDP